jgi:hypothetical protein
MRPRSIPRLKNSAGSTPSPRWCKYLDEELGWPVGVEDWEDNLFTTGSPTN